MSQGYQAAPPGAQHTFPLEIFQLAAFYGLGQPQAQYDHTGAGCLRIAIASFLGLLTLMAALLFGVFFMVFAQLPGSPFSSFLFPIIFIAPALAILAFLLYGFSLLRSWAYVCTGGSSSCLANGSPAPCAGIRSSRSGRRVFGLLATVGYQSEAL